MIVIKYIFYSYMLYRLKIATEKKRDTITTDMNIAK